MATKRKTASKAETPNASAASRLPALEFQNAPKPDGQMADLYIFSTTNDLSGKIGVFAGTRLGPIQIVGIKKSYSMHIKWALLQFSGTGYKAATQPKRYRRQLDDNDIKIVVERVLKQGSKSSLYASLKARLPKFNFVSGQIDWSWGQDKSKSTTETIKS